MTVDQEPSVIARQMQAAGYLPPRNWKPRTRWATPLELFVWGFVIAVIGSGVFAWLRLTDLQMTCVRVGYLLILLSLIIKVVQVIKRRKQ